ncbi:MAG: hypothetical protein GY847_14365 [Proteobacteria bacterium]|nr:hypothetical protein [Pseudomonadota bacterium]
MKLYAVVNDEGQFAFWDPPEGLVWGKYLTPTALMWGVAAEGLAESLNGQGQSATVKTYELTEAE